MRALRSPLMIDERRREILKILQTEGRVAVDDLVGRFRVSAVTLRTDLAHLAAQGLLVRSYSGGMLPEGFEPRVSTQHQGNDSRASIPPSLGGSPSSASKTFRSFAAPHTIFWEPMSSPVPALETVVSFSEQDLALFSEASGDRNPLHVDAEYAGRTPYGQQVVFGCLSAVACLNHLSLPVSWAPTWIEAEFLRPIFLGVSYRVETSIKDGVWLARLFDGACRPRCSP